MINSEQTGWRVINYTAQLCPVVYGAYSETDALMTIGIIGMRTAVVQRKVNGAWIDRIHWNV